MIGVWLLLYLGFVFLVIFIISYCITLIWQKHKSLLDIAEKQPLPDILLLKPSLAMFIYSFVGVGLFIATFFMFKFILSKASWDEFNLSMSFVFAVALIGSIVVANMLGLIGIFIGFFMCSLSLEKDNICYTDWLGRKVSFFVSDISKYSISEFGGARLYFVDKAGKKCVTSIYLSIYSRIILYRFLEKYKVCKR